MAKEQPSPKTMKQVFEVIIFVIIGAILLWFGYTLFFRLNFSSRKESSNNRNKPLKPKGEGIPGDPQICPVCSAKLGGGELVSSTAFPSLNGGNDRFMHIKGCIYCLGGERERVCPVCGTVLNLDEILISRLFERRSRRSHVHVIGCSRCRGPRSNRP